MSGRRGHRAWGSIKKQPTKRPSFQASFIGPDKRRHYAPHTFARKTSAEAWLETERTYRDRCSVTNERWRSIEERENEKKARAVLFTEYGTKVLEQRKLKDSTRAMYQEKWTQLIEPHFENVAIKDMSAQLVREWFAGLGDEYPQRNAHAYTVLSMICATAVEDGLLIANPCNIKGATSVARKPKGEPLTVSEVFAIANWLGSQEKLRQYKFLVLIAAFCGGTRIGEVTELRRKDIVMERDKSPNSMARWVPAIVKVERGVTHRQDCAVSTTKTKDHRRVDIPKLIQDDILELLTKYVPNDPNALLFKASERRAWTCDHVNPNAFNANVLKRAALKAIGRDDISAHSLRHFATTLGNHAGVPLKENMARTGHKSKQIHIDYIDRSTDNGKEMADRISEYALAELARTNDQNHEKTA